MGDIDIGDLATLAVNDLTTSLSGINDKATAHTELPGITKAFSEFDQLASLIDQLPPDARKTLVETFAAIKPDLNRLIIRALAIPGVGAIIKPTIDAIRSKLYALSTT